MRQLVLQTGCEPFRGDVSSSNSTAPNSLLAHIIRGCAQINDTSFPVYVDIIDTQENMFPLETDSGAVMYIVAVLVFYSAGIIVMIVKYLRREKRELEEERILEDFFRSMPEYKKEREQNKINKVAIHAFHALTSFSENTVDDYSSGEEDVPQKVEETIHEEVAEAEKKHETVVSISEQTGGPVSPEDQTQMSDLTVTAVTPVSDIKKNHETHL